MSTPRPISTSAAVMKAFAALAKHHSARRATVYLEEKYTVKVTRRHKYDGRNKWVTVMVTAGTPNYREKAFIARCKKIGASFPVKNVQLTPWPVPRKKK